MTRWRGESPAALENVMALTPRKFSFGKIFDTTDPDNQLGPLLLSIGIALVVILVAVAYSQSHPR